ncbi:fibronectin type III domain-containing protein [Flavivirga amylovorans]|uniref:Fibronectin type III domain-containing protein n=1 Tax=Flavivirga amylovorans TaxID=870486 RepID=A0ABT8X4H7_9FLAO|nr:fibronectin type III domain-containing protein [Flavivirga amylovorans]MDO5988877.1 fibronectin type III domain-containing protein [Flavivirga amylovorans]
MKSTIKLIILFICNISFAQMNLLDSSTWTVGTGSVSGFSHYGAVAENIREIGVNPYGTSGVLWKVMPDSDTSSSYNGGWETDYINIDHTKTYRFTTWMKKTNSNDGSIYFAFFCRDNNDNAAGLKLDGIVNSAPYPFSADLPLLDQWYLMVGYVHESNYSTQTSIGGVYDLNGIKQVDILDFKFSNTATRFIQRNYLRISNNINDELFLYNPTMYEVNGQEPTIQELIDGPDTQVPTTSTLSSAAQTDTTVDLSWTTATDNIAVTGYRVYKDGVLETTLGNVLIYQVTGLTASTAYNFTVTALDAAGNESILSNPINITTNVASGGGSGNWTLNNQNVYYNTGNVGIGTSTPDEKLAVNGNIHTKEVRVDLIGWSDFVFEKNYKLPSLKEVEQHIKEKGHLKDIPSAKKVKEHGILLGDMNAKLLQKIEELTLYILQQQREINKKDVDIFNLEKHLKTQENRIKKIEKLLNKN